MKTYRKPIGHFLVFALMFMIACGDSPPPDNATCNFPVPPGSIIQISTPNGGMINRPDTSTGTVSAPCGSEVVILAQFV